MRVLYSGASDCDARTLKRLLVIADEVAFMDRPSVTFPGWGTIGAPSRFRQVRVQDDDPVKVSVHEPSSGPARELHEPFIGADFEDPGFRAVFLEGLRREPRFAGKFIVPTAQYTGAGLGSDVVNALLNDASLATVSLTPQINSGLMFRTDTEEGRKETFKVLLAEASILVTSALLISEESGCVPITDEDYFARLLGRRVSAPRYVGTTARATPWLGLEIAKAVVPDDMLEKLSIGEIVDYRRAAKDSYDAWSVEINALGARLDEMAPDAVKAELPRILASEIHPRVVQYRNEMISVRDRLFGGLVKEATSWRMPVVGVAFLSPLSIPYAAALFAGAVLPAVPHVVEYFNGRKAAGRKHAMSYLLGLRETSRGEETQTAPLLRPET